MTRSLNILLLAALVTLTACSTQESVQPINDDPTSYSYSVSRSTLLDQNFNGSAGTFTRSGGAVVINNGQLRIGQTANGYDTARANVAITAVTDYEVEFTMTQVSGTGFAIQWGRTVTGDFLGERLTVRFNQNQIDYFADRTGAAPSPATLIRSIPSIATGTAVKFTFRKLRSNVYLFVNEGYVGGVSGIADNETQSVAITTQGVSASEIAVDQIRISRLQE